MRACQDGDLEIVKLFVQQKGIDINAKNIVYFIQLIFQSNIWYLFKLFISALMFAAQNGHTEIVKLLLKQKGIDFNAKDVFLLCLKFISMI